MNWDAIGAIGELAGALAVVFTLFYLAVQIRQNTSAVKASTHHAISDSFNVVNKLLASDPNIARIFRLGNTGLSALSEDEQVAYSFILTMFMRVSETLYYQHKQGFTEQQTFLTEDNTLKWAFSNLGFREWWQTNPISFSPDFQQYIADLIEDIESTA